MLPGAPHAQHIHIGGQHTCPGNSQKGMGPGGHLRTTDGAPEYGAVQVSLTTSGDTSAKSALAVTRFSVGNATYERTVTLPAAIANQVRAGQGVVVRHGVDDQAAWFSGSPRPGQTGPAVIVGHIDGPGHRTSVFFRLGALTRGARVTVTRADHSIVTFEVYRVERYAKDGLPTVAVYGNTTGPELRLITRRGSFDPSAGPSRDNTVAYARMVTG